MKRLYHIILAVTLAACLNGVRPTPLPRPAADLLAAIQAADIDGVRKAIDDGADVEQVYGQLEMRPLHVTAWFNVPDAVDVLIGKHANLEARDAAGLTPLHVALERCNHPVTTRLLERGADLHAVDSCGRTCLHLAAEANDLEMAKLMVDRGLDINAADKSGWTILEAAASSSEHGDALVAYLLEKGAHADATGKDGGTAVHVAAAAGGSEAITDLLNKRLQVNQRLRDGRTPLHIAAKRGDPTIISLLLKNGADPNLRDTFGQTALALARKCHRDEAAAILQQAANAPTSKPVD